MVPAPRPLPRRGERGFAAILVALLALVLLGLVGFALDTARVQTTARELQAAADAAALAGARRLGAGSDAAAQAQARQDAVAVGLANRVAGAALHFAPNDGNDPTGDLVVGNWDPTARSFAPGTAAPDAFRAVARRTAGSSDGALGLVFGKAFGTASSDVSRSAVARVTIEASALLHALSPTAKDALVLSGNASIALSQGWVQVDSSNGCALDTSGSSTLSAPSIHVTGGACTSGTVSGSVKTGVDPMGDPYPDLLPTAGAWNAVKNAQPKPLGNKGKIDKDGTFAPGDYPGGIDLRNASVAHLQPGLYVIGTGLAMRGSAQLLGEGITLLIDKGAKVDVGGGASMVVTPPDTGPFAGITLFSHRDNTQADAVLLGGNGLLDIGGIVYVPGGTLQVKGTGDVQIGKLLASKIDLGGNAVITGAHVPPTSPSGCAVLVR